MPEVQVKTRNSHLIRALLTTVAFSGLGLGCGGGSGNDAGPGGGADGGPGGIDQAAKPDFRVPSLVDQASASTDQAASAVDQAAAKMDSAVGADAGAGDAPLAGDAPQAGDVPGVADKPGVADVPIRADMGILADVAILADVTVPTDGPTLALDHLKFGPNGLVTVTFAKGSGSGWIGLYAPTSPDNAYITFQYTGAVASGSLNFATPEATGPYEFRMFADSGYNKIATSPAFTVSYPYDLDPGFATSGRLSFDFLGNGLVDIAYAVIPLASGKIVVAGFAKTGLKDIDGWEQNEFAVARLNADGSFDTTFGQGGRAHAAPITHSLFGCSAAAVSSDGKVVVGGWGHGMGASNTTGTDYLMARFTSTGTLDTAFGSAGFVTTNFKASTSSMGENDKLMSLALLADGRILAAGELMYAAGSYNNGLASFARYTEAGAPDNTFGGTGMITIDLASMSPPGGQTVFDVNSLVVTSTGGFFAGITAISSFGRNDTAIASLKADGSLDTTFGSKGVLWETKPGTRNNQYLTQLALTPTGSLLMLGQDLYTWFLGRYTAAGAVDTAFGTSGQTVADLSDSWDLPAGMVVASDGSTLVGISPDSLDGASMSGNLGLVRHDALGKSDNVFGKMRWKWTTGGATLASRATSFATQADGKLLLAGLVENPGGNQDFAVIRLVKSADW